MSWSTSEVRVRSAPLNQFKPSSKIFYWLFQGCTSFVDLLCFSSVLCLLCLCARLFICALWSPAGKGLTSWLSFVVSNCEFVTFPLVSWVRYFIVSIPDRCTLTYYDKFHAQSSWAWTNFYNLEAWSPNLHLSSLWQCKMLKMIIWCILIRFLSVYMYHPTLTVYI